MQSGPEARQAFQEGAFQFRAHAEKGRAQHDAGDALGMRLRVSQRQRAPQDPPTTIQRSRPNFSRISSMSAIRCGRVLASRPAFRAASPGAALIEQHGVKALGIEQPAMVRLAPAAGTAMQVDRGNAVGPADALDMDLMAVADRQQVAWSAARTDRSDDWLCGVGVRRHRRRPFPACHRRNCGR